MAIRTCNKLTQGTMEYEIDYVGRWLRLVSDTPASGEVGGSFSKETISFDTINTVLATGNLGGNSKIFGQCFKGYSANNPTMLAAALMDLGKIDSSYTVLGLL